MGYADEVIINNRIGLKTIAIARQIVYLEPSKESTATGSLEPGKSFAIIGQRRSNDYEKDRSTLWLHIVKINFVIAPDDYGWITGELYKMMLEENENNIVVKENIVYIIGKGVYKASDQTIFESPDKSLGAFYWDSISDGYDFSTKASIYIFNKESGEIVASLDNQYMPLIENQPELFFSFDNKLLILKARDHGLSQVYVFDIGNDKCIWQGPSPHDWQDFDGRTIPVAISLNDRGNKQFEKVFMDIDKAIRLKYNEYYAASINEQPSSGLTYELYFIYMMDLNNLEYSFRKFEWIYSD
jgi:hypothetical protein